MMIEILSAKRWNGLGQATLLAVAMTLVGCGGEGDGKSNSAAGEAVETVVVKEGEGAVEGMESAASEAAPEQPVGLSADALFASPPTVDMDAFVSNAPVPRADEPSRGVLRVPAGSYIHTPMEHWEQYDFTTFEAGRPGRYKVVLTYTLSRPSLPLQFRLGEQRLKMNLRGSRSATRVELGEITLEQGGGAPFALFTPGSGGVAALDIQEVAFVPAKESDEEPRVSADGSVELSARMATTWSEVMRYERKPEKDCLGFWTDEEDFAEWSFVLPKPGRYEVAVVQGCGEGQGGSEVAVRVGEQELKFEVEETGGFQNWKERVVGVVEVKDAGLQRLVVKPLNKKAKAVLDVQKVLLKPVS
jgi:hypothetical protein